DPDPPHQRRTPHSILRPHRDLLPWRFSFRVPAVTGMEESLRICGWDGQKKPGCSVTLPDRIPDTVSSDEELVLPGIPEKEVIPLGSQLYDGSLGQRVLNIQAQRVGPLQQHVTRSAAIL